ncbi:MBL fold metallo-hydrolase [Azospirillum soli]|uniref:MBL fold metallo-hydrolase n=1 Tax=Azospirillum soli TaxID=1304799 RepID=UPI001AEAD5C5|nr:MBL fold metallo-hydrolase [Azospirillum soli]MBP2312932.1 ribonuclease J [Azospirillum soli]
MKVCIHRGTKQIGGLCIELEHQGARLVLDLGLPLDADAALPDLLPPVAGCRDADASLLGVVVSHPHQDHYGLARRLPASTPLVLGAAAERIIAAAAPFVPGGVVLRAARHLRDGVPLEIGPFRVTPYLVDHSAYDAYALLVEAGGRRLFYSGDLRAHGRKAALFERLLARAPRGVDALLLEGSSIGRRPAEDRVPTEADLETALAALAQATSGPVLVGASAQNIDRVVTVFRAARRTGRLLVIDLYAAAILAATGNPNIPQSHWDGVRLFVPAWQRRAIKRQRLFDLLERHARRRVFPEDLAGLAPNAMVLFRASMARDWEEANGLAGARLVWSQWGGYLNEPAAAGLVAWCNRLSLPFDHLHTSGHAAVADLQRLAAALTAKRVVPIHSFETARYAEFFSKVARHNDGEWWSL